MRRRDLLSVLGGAAAFGASAAWPERSALAQSTQTIGDELDIDPYYLDSGVLTDAEQAEIVRLERIRQREMEGLPAVGERAAAPRRAPTYRFVHWSGDIGDPNGRFVSPLGVETPAESRTAYEVNSQILGFRCATEDWGRRADRGTLTVELRASIAEEPQTWLFVQQFDVDSRGFTNIGYEYVAQRDGRPSPAFTEPENIGLRIQLIRAPSRSRQIFRKLLSSALVLSGVPLESARENLEQALSHLPPLRVPALLQEGVAFTQAVVGGTAQETPIWRGGFTSYGLSSQGSPLALTPGLWLAIDADRELDLRGVVLDDTGGTIAPLRDGEILDCNYLVLRFGVNEGTIPSYLDRA
jgi:hypothetical protein